MRIDFDLKNQNLRLISPDDCGNSPKKKILKELIEAFAKNDVDFVAEYCTENVKWNIVNDVYVQGLENVLRVYEKKLTSRIVEIELLNIITHGNVGAVNGTATLADHRVYSFCIVYNFVSAGKKTIKEITTYAIKMNNINNG